MRLESDLESESEVDSSRIRLLDLLGFFGALGGCIFLDLFFVGVFDRSFRFLKLI